MELNAASWQILWESFFAELAFEALCEITPISPDLNKIIKFPIQTELWSSSSDSEEFGVGDDEWYDTEFPERNNQWHSCCWVLCVVAKLIPHSLARISSQELVPNGLSLVSVMAVRQVRSWFHSFMNPFLSSTQLTLIPLIRLNGIMLSESDYEECDVNNKVQAADESPKHSVVFEKLLKVIMCCCC